MASPKKQSFPAFEVREAQITDIEEDVVVNSIGVNVSLALGALCQAISKMAGPEAQKYLRDNYGTSAASGSILKSPGFNFPCHWILHVVLKNFDQEASATKFLGDLIKKILETADELSATGILFPAIGTGMLRYPKHIVAGLLFSETSQYLKSHPQTKLQRIVFLVYPGDKELLDIYNKLLEDERKKPSAADEASKKNAASILLSLVKGLAAAPKDVINEFPSNWTSKPSDKTHETIEVLTSDPEYEDVLATICGANGEKYVNFIYKIERIENRNQHKMYNASKHAMSKESKNERILWHGTSADAVENIMATGFNRNYGGKNAMYYGIGVYFAVNFSYSAHDKYSPPHNGRKYVFQSRVLTGNHCKGQHGMLEPPFMDEKKKLKYDSTTDDPLDPKIFVTFKDFSAYPEYLITFYSQ